MRKSFVILSAFFLFNISLSLLYSCNKDKYGGGGCSTGTNKSKYCATLKSLNITPMRRLGDSYSYDTIATHEFVLYRNFVLSVTLTGEETICYKKLVNPFINAAYACTPPIPSLNFKGTINKVSITSDQDFDDTHAEGADLSAYFEIVNGRNDLNEMEYAGNGITGNHKFMLKSSPKTNGAYTFTVTYHLTNGNQVQAQCVPVNLIR